MRGFPDFRHDECDTLKCSQTKRLESNSKQTRKERSHEKLARLTTIWGTSAGISVQFCGEKLGHQKMDNWDIIDLKTHRYRTTGIQKLIHSWWTTRVVYPGQKNDDHVKHIYRTRRQVADHHDHWSSQRVQDIVVRDFRNTEA